MFQSHKQVQPWCSRREDGLHFGVGVMWVEIGGCESFYLARNVGASTNYARRLGQRRVALVIGSFLLGVPGRGSRF